MTIDRLQEQSSGAYRARIAECKELLRLAISEIRNLSYLLHPPLMDEIGLSSAVAEYVRGFEERSGIRVKVEVSEELGRLEQDREIALFRIIQESFVNIHRHSGSPTASLSLSSENDAVVLEIRDQGKGFQQASADSTNFGLGIRSMQERLRTFGGTLQLLSTDAGTMVRAELPRAAAAELRCQQSA
jgi:signal transduction histidine kinase